MMILAGLDLTSLMALIASYAVAMADILENL